LVEAIRTDAPVGVVEELLPVLRFTSRGAAGFDRNSALAKELSALQGLRDSSEIEAALARRTADALDDQTRVALERMRLFAARQPASDELHVLAPDETSPDSTFPFVDGSGPTTGPTDETTGPTEPAGTGEPSTGTDETGTGTSGGVDSGASSWGAELGAVIGSYLGGPSGAEQGSQIGAQLAGQAGGISPSDLGSQIGAQLAGSEGAQIGAQLGSQVGGGGRGGGLLDRLRTLIDAAACALCGAVLCLPCVLAAEVVTDVVVQEVQQALQ
jgi:hypothetical protein